MTVLGSGVRQKLASSEEGSGWREWSWKLSQSSTRGRKLRDFDIFRREIYQALVAFRYHKLCFRERAMSKKKETMLKTFLRRPYKLARQRAARHCSSKSYM